MSDATGSPAADRTTDGTADRTEVRPVRRTAAFLGREHVTWRQATEGTTALVGALAGCAAFAVVWRRLRRH